MRLPAGEGNAQFGVGKVPDGVVVSVHGVQVPRQSLLVGVHAGRGADERLLSLATAAVALVCF